MKKENNASNEEALKKAIGGFVYRAPFNVLTEEDINWLARTFATLPDPTILADIMSRFDGKRDAAGLKDREWIFDLVSNFHKQQGVGKWRILPEDKK